MALSFLKKSAGTAAAKPAQGSTSSYSGTTSPKTTMGATGTKAPPPAANSGKTASWMKKGEAAKGAIAQAEAKAEAAKEEAGKLWRFWMPADSERKVTFLDGDLGEDGMLDIPVFNEHRVKVNGDWESFVCVAENEPCPGCETGDNRATLVGVLTIIDHTPYTIKNGANAGKTKNNTRKLFIATRQTMKLLTTHAKKIGGLRGATFTIMRTGDKEPGVGNQFIWDNEKHTPAKLAQMYDMKPDECLPADYSHEITYRDAATLAELGWVKAVHGVGNEKGVDTAALKKQL